MSAESIGIRTAAAAAGLDASGRLLHLADGTQVGYDRLVIATGAHSRRLPGLPDGLHRIRGYEDALRLRQALAGRGDVVIIGGGFIGCEVASSARALGVAVTVVEAQGDPLVRVLGPAVARRVARLHERHGVRIAAGASVREVTGAPGQWRVRLDSGQALDAAVVVEAVGAVPATAWLDRRPPSTWPMASCVTRPGRRPRPASTHSVTPPAGWTRAPAVSNGASTGRRRWSRPTS